MQDTMDEDEYILDLSEHFSFGDEENDTDVVFAEYSTATRNSSVTWQKIVEMKSASHEGYMAYRILCEREQEGLPLYAKSLFSIHSPIEQLSQDTDFFNGTIASRQMYLDQRQDIIAKLSELMIQSPKGSQVLLKFAEVKELLAMQLYGFGRAALQEDELSLSLDAFHAAGVMRKEKVIELIRSYIAENPETEEEVKEYIHLNL